MAELHDDRPLIEPFAVKDCAVIAIATARRAVTVHELLDGIALIPPESLYYHFFTGLLQARFEEPEYNNDFAGWVANQLHDSQLAEQLAVVDPTSYSDPEALRSVLLEIIQVAIDGTERLSWLRASRPFDFVRSQIVIFDTGRRAANVAELATLLPELPAESIFYHFIDARRREPLGRDDFGPWLECFGPQTAPLVESLANVDCYFDNLAGLKQRIVRCFEEHPEAAS